MVSILYLHGVGQGYRSGEWYDAFAATLEAFGLPRVKPKSRRLLRPDYVDLVQGVPPGTDVPKLKSTVHKLSKDRERELRWRYARAQAGARRELTHVVDSPGLGATVGRLAGVGLQRLPLPGDLAHANRYLKDEQVRRSILTRVLSRIEGHDELVIIAHSLGSVVAVDLLGHLPSAVQVRRLITIGSPLGLPWFHKGDRSRVQHAFPWAQVSSWFNVLSIWDGATMGMGIGQHFPAASDVRIELPWGAHAAHRYISHPTVGQLIHLSLAGRHTTFSGNKSVDVRVSLEEEVVLNGLAFGGLVHHRLTGERKQRYEQALSLVGDQVLDALVRRRTEEGMPVPRRILEAEHGTLLSLASTGDIDRDLSLVVVMETGNAVAPYDIDVSDDSHVDAGRAWEELGYPAQDAGKVASAIVEAEKAFRTIPWGRYVAGAAGLALVAAAPVGLMLAVPAGVFGGAAIVSALASFGPGGMLGGMVFAGALVGTGTATAAFAAASQLSPAMLETELVRRMAVSLARKNLGLPDDGDNWRLMAAWQSELAEERERHRGVTDADSPSMKMLNRKCGAVDRAIWWMAERGLTPAVDERPHDEEIDEID